MLGKCKIFKHIIEEKYSKVRKDTHRRSTKNTQKKQKQKSQYILPLQHYLYKTKQKSELKTLREKLQFTHNKTHQMGKSTSLIPGKQWSWNI